MDGGHRRSGHDGNADTADDNELPRGTHLPADRGGRRIPHHTDQAEAGTAQQEEMPGPPGVPQHLHDQEMTWMRSPHTTGYAALFRGFHAIHDEKTE